MQQQQHRPQFPPQQPQKLSPAPQSGELAEQQVTEALGATKASTPESSISGHGSAGAVATRHTERSSTFSVASWEDKDHLLPADPTSTAAQAVVPSVPSEDERRQISTQALVASRDDVVRPMGSNGEEEEEEITSPRAANTSKDIAAKSETRRQEKREQVLDKLFNFKAAPKPTAAPPGGLGELRHLDMLPPSHQASLNSCPSPAPGLSRGAASFQLPPSVMNRQDTPQLAPIKSEPSAPVPPPINLAEVSAGSSADPGPVGGGNAVITPSVDATPVTPLSIEKATTLARTLGDITTVDVEVAVVATVEYLLGEVEQAEEADLRCVQVLTMEHFTLLRLVGKVG